MALMTNQFAIKVHFYSCLLLTAIVVCRSSAAVATAANDTDYSGYNSSSSSSSSSSRLGSYNNMANSVQPVPMQSFSSTLLTSSSPRPMSLTNVSAITIITIDKVVSPSDVTATTQKLRSPPTSTTISLPRNLKFIHEAPTETEKLDVGKRSTDTELQNLTSLVFIASGNTTENESKTKSETKDKMNSTSESKIFVVVLNSSDAAVDKKSFPFKRHLASRPSEDASHADRSDKKQMNFNSNATSNNEIHHFYPLNFSDAITGFLNSSVAGDLNISVVVVAAAAVANSTTSLGHDNSTNDDDKSLKNQAVEKYENNTEATNATVKKYPPLTLTNGTPLSPETGVSVSDNYGNPIPNIHSTFDSPTPSFETNFLTTTTATITTEAAATKTKTTAVSTTKTTTALATTTTTAIKEQQHLTFEQSTKRRATLSRQFQSSERLFNADLDNADKRNEVVTVLLLSANETVEEPNKSVLQLEHKSDSRRERAKVAELQRSDSLDDATYDKSSDLKVASTAKKTTDEDKDNRSGMTVKRRRRKNAKRRKDRYLPFVPVEVTTTEPFPTRRHHHHRYHPVNHHRQQIFPPVEESSFSAEDSGERRDRNSGRNKNGQRRPGRRERTRTKDDPSLDIARKQLPRNRLESPKRGSDNSLTMLSSAESSETEEANKYSSSPLVLPPLRNRDPKRQRSSLPSYVHKRSPSGSFESNEITPQASSKSFTFSDCGKDPDRTIKFLKFRLDPAPIQLSTWGGKVKLSAKVNVTKSLPPLVTANVTIIKFVVGVPIPVPCFNHMGSCHYKNLCKQLDELWNNLQTRYQMKTPDQPDPLESRDNDVESDSTPNIPPPPPPWRKPSPLLIAPNHSACPRLLRSQYVPCKCPFYPSLYTLKKYIVPIPSLGFSSMFVEGEYEIKLEINNGEDKSQLGCLKASFEMRRRERKVYII